MSKFENLHIGVLALQGAFERHMIQLGMLDVKASVIKLPGQLEQIDGLIIPGGESTTMDKLIDRFDLRTPLIEFAESKPVYGTCAGMIMVSKNIIDNQAGVTPLELIDIDVVRTGYGRQVHSFETTLKADFDGSEENIPASFIRAPIIERIGEQVEKLAVYNGKPVLVKERNILAGSFHSELSENTTLLEYFLKRFLLPKGTF